MKKAIGRPSSLRLVGIPPTGSALAYLLPLAFDKEVCQWNVIGGTISAVTVATGSVSTFTLGLDGIGLRFDISPKNIFLAIPAGAIPSLILLGLVNASGVSLTQLGEALVVRVFYC